MSVQGSSDNLISVTYQPASSDVPVVVQLPAGSTVGHLLAHRAVNSSATGLVFLVNGNKSTTETILSEGSRVVSMKAKVAGAVLVGQEDDIYAIDARLAAGMEAAYKAFKACAGL